MKYKGGNTVRLSNVEYAEMAFYSELISSVHKMAENWDQEIKEKKKNLFAKWTKDYDIKIPKNDLELIANDVAKFAIEYNYILKYTEFIFSYGKVTKDLIKYIEFLERNNGAVVEISFTTLKEKVSYKDKMGLAYISDEIAQNLRSRLQIKEEIFDIFENVFYFLSSVNFPCTEKKFPEKFENYCCKILIKNHIDSIGLFKTKSDRFRFIGFILLEIGTKSYLVLKDNVHNNSNKKLNKIILEWGRYRYNQYLKSQ